MVIQPVREIGKYGGTWRRGFTTPGDDESGNRLNASDRPLLVDHTGATPLPPLAKGWEQSADGKNFTLHLRRGLRWSDGAPMTAADFIFWFDEIYGNKDITPTPIPDTTPAGEPGRMVKVDDYTVHWEFDVPFFLFEELTAGPDRPAIRHRHGGPVGGADGGAADEQPAWQRAQPQLHCPALPHSRRGASGDVVLKGLSKMPT